MNLKLIFRISRSLLFARWRQTLVAAIGVTFSVTMFIGLLGFMTGLNDLLDGLILNRVPHIRLFHDVKGFDQQPVNVSDAFKDSYNFVQSAKSVTKRLHIYNSATIIQTLRADPRVTGVAPKISSPVMFHDGPFFINGIISGIDAQAEAELFYFDDYVIAGKSVDIQRIANSIILGKALADKLFASIGDIVFITTSSGEVFPLRVVAFFQSGLEDIDKIQSYAALGTVQKLLGKSKDYVTDIQLKINEIEHAPALSRHYAQLFQLGAEDIQTVNAQFETGTFVRTLISYVVGITLLIVSGFGIYNILNMMIYEKMDSIAILKATGFSGFDVNLIFLLIALSIGLFGGLLGLIFGFLVSLMIDNVPFDTAALPTIETYPVNYNAFFYFVGGFFSLFTTYLAGLFPARKASKVDPVVIIRGK